MSDPNIKLLGGDPDNSDKKKVSAKGRTAIKAKIFDLTSSQQVTKLEWKFRSDDVVFENAKLTTPGGSKGKKYGVKQGTKHGGVVIATLEVKDLATTSEEQGLRMSRIAEKSNKNAFFQR